MNIKKKISFFALFLISSFFIVSEVKGYDNYGLYGGGNNQLNKMKDVTGSSWEFSESGIGFRVTFTNETGVKISGSKIVDYYPKGTNVYFVPSNNKTTGKYKFSTSSESINIIKNFDFDVNGCSNSRGCNKEFINTWINKIKNNTFMKTLLSNAGITNPSNTVYIVVEKLYTILVVNQNRSVCNTTNCQNLKENKCKELTTDPYDGTLDSAAFNECKMAMVIYNINDTQKSYRGTASEIAEIIDTKRLTNDDVYNNLWLSGDMKNELGIGFDIENTNDIYGFEQLKKDGFKRENFYAAKPKSKLNWSDIYNNSYANGLFIIKASVSNGCNSKTDADSMGLDWNATEGKCCAAGTKYNSKTGKCETPAICDATNYKSLGRDYNANYTNPEDNTHCCDVGKKYNPKRNDCETVESECNGSNYYSLKRSFNTTLGVCCLPGQNLKDGKPQMVGSCFTKDSTPTNYDYNYYCYTQSNMCSKNNVNSTINSYVTTVKNGPTSMYKKGPTQSNLTDNQSGECILNNSAYYVGMVNGTKIYCSDSLETSLSGMISNLSVKSGTFMPVSSPTITVSHNCYFTPSSNWAKEQYPTGIETIYSRLISPSINLNFMNKDYKFNGSSSSVSDKSLSIQPQKTVYGNDYYTYSFKTTYTPGYSSSLLNKFVDKKTATGSGDSFGPINGMAYNQMSKNINISIPTDASGTYSAKYTLGSNSYSNPAINNILSNSTTTITNQYDTKKTVECGGTCKIEYSSVLLNCASTGSLIKKIFQNGYGSDLSISNTKDSCKFTMQFSVGSQAECTRAKGNLGTLTTTYTKKSCTEKVTFNTSVKGADSSCSNNVTVENIDIKEDLVFRPISLSNPFPGQNGNGRSMGSPWTDDLKKTYITNRSNVYSKKPLYSITLTPSTIKQIRDYNKDTSYDDFNLICSNGEACYSIFLRNYSKIINTNKSNCYNANDRSVNAFNSCADYSKRQ